MASLNRRNSTLYDAALDVVQASRQLANALEGHGNKHQANRVRKAALHVGTAVARQAPCTGLRALPAVSLAGAIVSEARMGAPPEEWQPSMEALEHLWVLLSRTARLGDNDVAMD